MTSSSDFARSSSLVKKMDKFLGANKLGARGEHVLNVVTHNQSARVTPTTLDNFDDLTPKAGRPT